MDHPVDKVEMALAAVLKTAMDAGVPSHSVAAAMLRASARIAQNNRCGPKTFAEIAGEAYKAVETPTTTSAKLTP